jgi:GDP-L-fucose synthase|tara:strand:+ start:1985 stop:2938 length:954 start_codon:yes stop_codon:yes gene_type:complete
MINKSSKIFIAGHNGLVGNAVFRKLKSERYKKLIFANRKKLDLLDLKKVEKFFALKKPDFLIICAAKVGGILANKNYQLEFLLNNLNIQNNLLIAAKKYNIKRTIFLGSSCIYPKKSKIPIKEEYLMTGKLEKTNEAYAIAKIAGIKHCSILFEQFNCDVACVMPTNVYGINDNFDIGSSHVIPGLISKFLDAKKINKDVTVWGSGKAIREFLHVDDLASAIVKILTIDKNKLNKIFHNEIPIFNVGSSESVSIKKLANMIKRITKFKGKVIFDKSYPDGTLNKNLDCKKIKKINWKPKIKLHTGLNKVIKEREKIA